MSPFREMCHCCAFRPRRAPNVLNFVWLSNLWQFSVASHRIRSLSTVENSRTNIWPWRPIEGLWSYQEEARPTILSMYSTPSVKARIVHLATSFQSVIMEDPLPSWFEYSVALGSVMFGVSPTPWIFPNSPANLSDRSIGTPDSGFASKFWEVSS